MSDKKSVRLNKLVKEFNVSIDRIYSFLESKDIEDLKPNSKVSHDIYMDLLGEFDSEKKAKLSAELLAKEKELVKAEEIIKQQETEDAAQKVAEAKAKEKARLAAKKSVEEESDLVQKSPKVLDKIDLELKNKREVKKEATVKGIPTKEDVPKAEAVDNKEGGVIKASAGKLKGIKETGQKIDLAQFKKPEKVEKKKRTRIVKAKVDPKKFKKGKKPFKKETVEISPEEAQKRVRETLAKLQGSGKKSSVKNRKEKRDATMTFLFSKDFNPTFLS